MSTESQLAAAALDTLHGARELPAPEAAAKLRDFLNSISSPIPDSSRVAHASRALYCDTSWESILRPPRRRQVRSRPWLSSAAHFLAACKRAAIRDLGRDILPAGQKPGHGEHYCASLETLSFLYGGAQIIVALEGEMRRLAGAWAAQRRQRARIRGHAYVFIASSIMKALGCALGRARHGLQG